MEVGIIGHLIFLRDEEFSEDVGIKLRNESKIAKRSHRKGEPRGAEGR